MTSSPPLVLIVDDFAPGREVSAEYFAYRGYRVETAKDGAEALEKAFELRPDIILMDLSLPRIDGWEATRRLRRDERTRDLKIVALTAHALARERDRALAAGCDDVVTKPVQPKELLALVESLLRKGGTDGEVGGEE